MFGSDRRSDIHNASDFHMEATTSSSFEPSLSFFFWKSSPSSVYFSVPLKKPERYPSPYLIVSPDSFRPCSVDASHAFLGSMFLLDEKVCFLRVFPNFQLKLFQGPAPVPLEFFSFCLYEQLMELANKNTRFLGIIGEVTQVSNVNITFNDESQTTQHIMEAIQIDGVFDVQASKLHQNLDGVGVEPKGPISASTKNFGEDGVTSSASYTKYGDVQKIETVTVLKLNAYVLKSRCRYISLLRPLKPPMDGATFSATNVQESYSEDSLHSHAPIVITLALLVLSGIAR
ncbi:hypothetical protein F2Q68_00007937 [Brassica cretica]|uniref:Uncharacterized protein n=1 Tax=Brassica cretica TaxID=69181 RepID=A0A8S9L4B7_BRACR|nr:hypothetical protein F2Q68_00007937 [Brassica cretica]